MTQNRKVLEQEQLAERIHAEAYGNTNKAPETTDGGKPPEENLQTQPTQPEVQPKVVSEETWEQKYRVLQGKYSAEVPRMAEEIRELKAMVQELKTAPAAPQTPPLDLKGMTPEAVVEQFGEDFAAAVGAIAARIAESQGQTIREEFRPQIEQTTKSVAQTKRQEFIRDLAAAVPDFKEIDVNPAFTEFLDEVDPMTGRSRRFFFNEADGQNDAVRVAQFFNAFKGNSPANQSATQQDSRMSIDSMIQPDTSRKSGSAPTQRFWTQADVRKFYNDLKRGLYSSAEAARIESDIFAAGREGRMAA